ncbi:MAG: DUF4917 family protein [Acetobacter sp.]|uniref:DUF4917 family protein n=1 Tax=Acetobacter sp. TaxID=440 RepID=UPI0039E9AA67
MTFTIYSWPDISSKYYGGTIILGNGSSVAVSPCFGYSSLLENAQEKCLLTEDVYRLFNFFSTYDFELILRLVWQASNINNALSIPDNRTHNAYLNVRESLIKAVRDVHPEYITIINQLPSMYKFLKSFNTVFSLNYDLLVYWTITYGFNIDDGHRFKDCFLNGGVFHDDWKKFYEPYNYHERSNTLVFYPHGNLALCRNLIEQEIKIHARDSSLLESILNNWRTEQYVPLFVSEGTMEQKITSIQSSYYLSTVYREILTSPRSTLTIYGWGIGNHDRHLLKRMQGCGIQRVAVSVFNKDQSYCNYAYHVIQEEIGPVGVDFFDSNSPECWINSSPDSEQHW